MLSTSLQRFTKKKTRDALAIKLSHYLGYYPFEQDFRDLVYTYLGNDVNRKLCEDFINCGLDINIIIEYRRNKK